MKTLSEELDIISYLSNPYVRSQTREVICGLKPISTLGKTLLEFYTNLSDEYIPEDAVIEKLSKITVVEIKSNSTIEKGTAFINTINHGENVVGRNIVAILDGKLCNCEWCQNLIKRIQSRITQIPTESEIVQRTMPREALKRRFGTY